MSTTNWASAYTEFELSEARTALETLVHDLIQDGEDFAVKVDPDAVREIWNTEITRGEDILDTEVFGTELLALNHVLRILRATYVPAPFTEEELLRAAIRTAVGAAEDLREEHRVVTEVVPQGDTQWRATVWIDDEEAFAIADTQTQGYMAIPRLLNSVEVPA